MSANFIHACRLSGKVEGLLCSIYHATELLEQPYLVQPVLGCRPGW